MTDATDAVPLPTRLDARFRIGAGPEERLTFPVWPNKGAVVKFERLALDPGVALSTPTATTWSKLRETCELVGAFSWDATYLAEPDRTDMAEWSIEIDWPDRSVRSRGYGAFPSLTADAPPMAALGRLCSVLSRLVDGREVFGRAAYRRGRMTRSVTDASVHRAVRVCGARLSGDDRLLEVRLDSALSEGLHRVADVECREHMAPLQGWTNPKSDMREIDVFVDGLAFEQKVDDLDQQLWDAVKLVSMLRSGGDVHGAYLVAWARHAAFERAASGVMYRSAGQWEVADLVRRTSGEWHKGLAAGNNSPLETPARFRTTQIARVDCGDGREIRAVRVDLVDDEQITWRDGIPQALPSGGLRPATLSLDELIDAWVATLDTAPSWWHHARLEAYAAITGCDPREAPAALSGSPPHWFDPHTTRWGKYGLEAFCSDRAHTLHSMLQSVGKVKSRVVV